MGRQHSQNDDGVKQRPDEPLTRESDVDAMHYLRLTKAPTPVDRSLRPLQSSDDGLVHAADADLSFIEGPLLAGTSSSPATPTAATRSAVPERPVFEALASPSRPTAAVRRRRKLSYDPASVPRASHPGS